MKANARVLVVALVLLSLDVLTAAASEQVLNLDPEQSTVSFNLKATGHDVEGTFLVGDGTIGFDPESGKAWGEIVIDTRKGNTGNEKRDKKMHEKVLESAEHPMATFRPERIEGNLVLDGESSFDLVGSFTLLGVEHSLTLPTTAKVHDGQVEATATFPIPYVEWGLHNPSIMVLKVAKVVDVTVSAVGRLSAGGAMATGE